MAKVFIEETTLTSIADAIRDKEGTTELVPVNDMGTRIIALPQGQSSSTIFLHKLLTKTLTTITAEDLEGLEYIAGAAFQSHNNLMSITLPSTMKQLSNPDGSTPVGGAFRYCNEYTELNLNEGLEVIEQESFYPCGRCVSVTIPSTVRQIGARAFYNSTRLTEVTFNTSEDIISKMYIDSTAFDCGYITDIYVPWAEGEVYNAPWGAQNATIHYNS